MRLFLAIRKLEKSGVFRSFYHSKKSRYVSTQFEKYTESTFYLLDLNFTVVCFLYKIYKNFIFLQKYTKKACIVLNFHVE